VDYKADDRSSIIDAKLNMVMDGNFRQSSNLYDNEWGYSCRTAELAAYIAKSLYSYSEF
jgi:glyceraldehyde 3-phosphate dehydrogenase